MARYGTQYGPDVTFLGVARCDHTDPQTYVDADVVILGAPFDGGTTNRPGARFGPNAIRTTDYLGQNGSRPSPPQPRPAYRRTAGAEGLRRGRRRDVLG